MDECCEDSVNLEYGCVGIFTKSKKWIFDLAEIMVDGASMVIRAVEVLWE